MATLIKKPVLVVIDKEILSMAKKTARKNGLNFSCFVQSLIEDEVLNNNRRYSK